MIALHVLVTSLGVALGVLYPFISVILAERGFSPGEIGLISSLGAVGFTVGVPAWGHLADVRLGRPRTLQICALGAGAAIAALVLPWPPLIVASLFGLFWIFESCWQPLADAVTVNALRGRDYARVRLFTSQTMTLQFDLYNALNTNDETTRSVRSGPTYGRITAIIPPRVARLGITYAF